MRTDRHFLHQTRTLKWEKGRFEERVMGIGIDA
jgi:hypothetical protein